MTAMFGILAFLLVMLGGLLVVSAGLFALAVVLSYSLAWYERIGSDPAVAAERQPALIARLLLTEFCCLLLTLLLRPLGWLPGRTVRRPNRQLPVILLHGLFQNRSSLLILQWRLRAAGFKQVISINTPPWRDLDSLVDTVASTVATVRAVTGCAKVHLVGHSMGGILARCFVQLRNGAPQVASCITLGTPHRGSKLAPFAISRLGRSLLPGSELLSRLNAQPLPAAIPFTAIYTRHDNIIVPAENARLDGAENVELCGMGHTSLLFSSQAARAVIAALKGTTANKDQEQP